MTPQLNTKTSSTGLPMSSEDNIGPTAMTTMTMAMAMTMTMTRPHDPHGEGEEMGLFLRWSRIHKAVTIKEDNSGLLRGSIVSPNTRGSAVSLNHDPSIKATTKSVKKVILHNVSGSAAPGQVLAMMGPSGSGKTTLLNSLSGRIPYDSGVVSLNGQPLGGSGMKRLMAKIGYVRQADIFFSHLTVRDQLGYTAFLRLPQDWTRQSKLDEVERIITVLRLTKVADSKIRTLSGGEQKRLNIGTELLTDPMILLLDEPTSGLDSTSAVALIKMLQDLARTAHKTIITSIHQPSSALFQSFDQLLMLADGHVVYYGPPRDSLRYLRSQNLMCPDGYNAADHWMDLLVQDSAIDDSNTVVGMDVENHAIAAAAVDLVDNVDDILETGGAVVVDPTEKATGLSRGAQNNHDMVVGSTTRQRLIESWQNESVAEEIDAYVEKRQSQNAADAASSLVVGEKSFSKYNTSWGLQYRVLVHRSLKNSRAAIFTPLNLIKSGALGLVSGLLWFQMEYTESAVFDRSSYFFFTMTFWVFDAMFQAFLAFPAERAVILKERAGGSYRLSAYFMGKTTSEMPSRLVLPFIYMLISFWMASISSRFSTFITTTLISLLSVMAGEAIGLFVGATMYDLEKGMTAMTVISLALALLGGFFVENVPSFLVWAKYLSPFKYSFDASLQLVFDEPVPCDGSGALEYLCGGSSTSFVDPADVIDFLGVQGSVGFNVGILLAIGLVPRYLAYLALRAKKEGDR